MICQRCSQTHQEGRCTGHVRAKDGQLRPCKQWPMQGATVCRNHGGAARQVRAKAAERLARARTERDVAKTLGEIGVSIPTSDGEALIEERDRHRGVVKALWTIASELRLVPSDGLAGTGSDGIYGPTFHQTGRPTGEAKPNVVMVMLADWSSRLAKIDEACVRLGLEARRVRATEAELVLFARAFDVALARSVPAEFHAAARAVLAGELRRLDGQELPASPEGSRS